MLTILTPAQAPAGLGQRAERSWRQQPGDGILGAVVGGEAPETLFRQNTRVNKTKEGIHVQTVNN